MNCWWLLVRHGDQGCMSSLCTSSWETFSWHPRITLEGDGLIFCDKQSQHYDNVHCCCFCFDLARVYSTFWRWWPWSNTLLVIISRLKQHLLLFFFCLIKWCNNRCIYGFFSWITWIWSLKSRRHKRDLMTYRDFKT